jgi:hypothetical protein
MSPLTYQLLHVISVFLLVGLTFQACAAPHPERRKKIMMGSGILGLVALVAGFGLSARLGYGFPVWMMIKTACWLGISAIAGIAFRKPESAGKLGLLASVLVIVAIAMVYVKPFV